MKMSDSSSQKVQRTQTSKAIRTVTYRPFGLLAELTYRCPLHCPYCSNPLQMSSNERELTTEEWQRVISEASRLGVLHILFSGGEPLLRKDLPALITTAQAAGMYTNLITSALGLTRKRTQQLKDAGLDSIQISFQADEANNADVIAGTQAHTRKLAAARLVRELGFPLTINAVLHRGNINRIANIIALAEELDAQRLELASTQFLGWAFKNKEALLPTRQQVIAAQQIASAARKRLRGNMEILYVLPDYYADRPKPCMHGWGQRYITVNPYGNVLPCQTASHIPSLQFDNVRQYSLNWIWHESASFNRFRGTDWLPEPCKSCPQQGIDFGGCRCQAFLLTGDAANTDPACALSPHRSSLTNIIERVQQQSTNKDQPDGPDHFLQRLHFRTNPIRVD
ncbi:MAG TPA: pyrroloquinoline quinone biosynthesis protein PqqE [Dictyobacter sp.]|nr:pyrroloquinoline quinone biosynthesis protein PqqE [Dictyobacter sp.]